MLCCASYTAALLAWHYIHGGPALLDYEAFLFDTKALSTFSFDHRRGMLFHLSDDSNGAGQSAFFPMAIHHAGRKDMFIEFRNKLLEWRFRNADSELTRKKFFDSAVVYVDGVQTSFRAICAEKLHELT